MSGADVTERVDEGDVFLGGVGEEPNDRDLHDSVAVEGGESRRLDVNDGEGRVSQQRREPCDAARPPSWQGDYRLQVPGPLEPRAVPFLTDLGQRSQIEAPGIPASGPGGRRSGLESCFPPRIDYARQPLDQTLCAPHGRGLGSRGRAFGFPRARASHLGRGPGLDSARRMALTESVHASSAIATSGYASPATISISSPSRSLGSPGPPGPSATVYSSLRRPSTCPS
jgi:hypothetical protein